MGMSMSTTTTFTLLAADGDHVRARQESTTVMEGPLGTEAAGELSGVGFVEWDLTLPCPTASSMQIGGTMTISMGDVEIEQTQTQVVQVTSR